MPRDRDVAAFAERAEGYEEGRRGRLHHEISDRTANLALAQVPAPRRVLDVGCGTGYLLRQLATRAPDAVELVVCRDHRGGHGVKVTPRLPETPHANVRGGHS